MLQHNAFHTSFAHLIDFFDQKLTSDSVLRFMTIQIDDNTYLPIVHENLLLSKKIAR